MYIKTTKNMSSTSLFRKKFVSSSFFILFASSNKIGNPVSGYHTHSGVLPYQGISNASLVQQCWTIVLLKYFRYVWCFFNYYSMFILEIVNE